MISKIKSFVGQAMVNSLGWKTNRKIVVIESDDWGGISMPSKEVYETLLKHNIKVNTNPYCKYDALASNDDLQELFNVLLKYKDINENSPVITANTNVANPDFTKIRESGFKQYYYEPFTETLSRYPHHSRAFELWKTGIEKGIFIPQFHGREHLNTKLWIDELKKGINDKLKLAFDLQCFNLPKDAFKNDSRIYNTAFYPNNEAERQSMLEAIPSGLELFESLIGYKATSFIGTGYYWNREIEGLLARHGIESLQGLPVQKEPVLHSKPGKRYNYTGKFNEHGQVFLVRNAFFEPSLSLNRDNEVDDCLKRIELSFKNKKPAIISAHRLNFIGYIEPSNRDKNLVLLDELIKKMLANWPDIEFMSSDKLSNIIISDKNGK